MLEFNTSCCWSDTILTIAPTTILVGQKKTSPEGSREVNTVLQKFIE